MSHNRSPGQAPFRLEPRTPLQWFVRWTEERRIFAPTRHGHFKYVMLKDLRVPEPGTLGDPDLLAIREDGKSFYVKFARTRVFSPMDLPVLVFYASGPDHAFWLMPR